MVDFGLAARPGGAAVGVNHAYLPADAAPDAADPDVDLFAAGIVLHELLTGDHPYEDRILLADNCRSMLPFHQRYAT